MDWVPPPPHRFAHSVEVTGHPAIAHSASCSVHSSRTTWAFWSLSTLVPGIRLWGLIVKEANLSGKWPSEEVSFVFPWIRERMEKEFSAVQSLADTPGIAGRNSIARG